MVWIVISAIPGTIIPTSAVNERRPIDVTAHISRIIAHIND
jgi:hypothetical protein